jgi:hypothetical protein
MDGFVIAGRDRVCGFTHERDELSPHLVGDRLVLTGIDRIIDLDTPPIGRHRREIVVPERGQQHRTSSIEHTFEYSAAGRRFPGPSRRCPQVATARCWCRIRAMARSTG